MTRRVAALFLLFTAVLLVCPAHASPYLALNATVQLSGPGEGITSNIPDQNAASGPIYIDTGVWSLGQANGRFKAHADYGQLGVSGDTSMGDYRSVDAYGGAMFVDTWTISDPALTGTPGTLKVWVDVDGTITGSGSIWGGRWRVGFLNDYSNSLWSDIKGQSYHGFMNTTLQFTYGVPFEFGIQLAGDAWNGGNVEYYDTMALNMGQSQVLDSAGSQVTDYTMTADSGHVYVPEPGTLSVLALGGLVLLNFRKR